MIVSTTNMADLSRGCEPRIRDLQRHLPVTQSLYGVFSANYYIYLFIYLFTPYLSYHRYLQGLANMKMFMSHSAKDDDSYFGIGFRLPYNELLLWAVLCNFHKMALFMWERGDENLAKALVAGKLFRSLAKEMAKDELKGDVSEELEAHSR